MRELDVVKIFDGVTVSAGSTITSDAIDLRTWQGYVSLQFYISGTGTCKFYYTGSNNLSDFMAPQGASDIITGLGATSGPGSDGKGIIQFSIQMCRQIKICCEETGDTDAVVVSAWIARV